MEVLDETQQELALLQASEKSTHEEIAALPKLRADLRSAQESHFLSKTDDPLPTCDPPFFLCLVNVISLAKVN